MQKVDEFKRIMEISNSNKVSIITNHYQITGEVYECDKCNKESYLNLTNASLCFINDIYDGIACESYSTLVYDWLHINFDKIVAFSFIK